MGKSLGLSAVVCLCCAPVSPKSRSVLGMVMSVVLSGQVLLTLVTGSTGQSPVIFTGSAPHVTMSITIMGVWFMWCVVGGFELALVIYFGSYHGEVDVLCHLSFTRQSEM